jgi:hypothetical protein
MIDMDEQGIFLPNWEKYQSIETLELYREREKVRKQEYRTKKRLEKVSGTLSGTTAGQSQESPRLDIEVEDIDKRINIKDKKILPPKSKSISEDSPYYKMAVYLHERIMEHAAINKKEHLVKDAKLDKWADEFRKMIELDKRDKAELKKIIDWCTKDPFWSTNILSADKLRKQYERLGLAMDKAPGNAIKSKEDQTKDVLKRRMEAIQNDRGTDGEDTGANRNSLPQF